MKHLSVTIPDTPSCMHHIICHVNQVKTSSFFSHDTAVHVGTDPIVWPLFTVPPFTVHLYWLGLLLPPFREGTTLFTIYWLCILASPKGKLNGDLTVLSVQCIVYTEYKTEHLKCVDCWNISMQVDERMKAAHTEIDDQVRENWEISHNLVL